MGAVDLGQRIVETIVGELVGQGVSFDVLADVLRTSPLRVAALCAGDEPWSSGDLARTCEYLEIDLAEVVRIPGQGLGPGAW